MHRHHRYRRVNRTLDEARDKIARFDTRQSTVDTRTAFSSQALSKKTHSNSYGDSLILVLGTLRIFIRKAKIHTLRHGSQMATQPYLTISRKMNRKSLEIARIPLFIL